MKNLFEFLIIVLICLTISCNSSKSGKYKFEVIISDSLLYPYLDEYIAENIDNYESYNQFMVMTICVDREYFQTRYFISESSINYIHSSPLDYYSYYKGHLILIYFSQDLPIHKKMSKYYNPMFTENNAWDELLNREYERFTNYKVVVGQPNYTIITQCVYKDSIKIDKMRDIRQYLKNELNKDNNFCMCSKDTTNSNVGSP